MPRTRPARSSPWRSACLAYAFQAHDFRIRYVARYSDRSMPWYYLVTRSGADRTARSCGGRFLLGVLLGVCAYALLKRRYLELAPYVIATLMSIIGVLRVLMLFAANPFATVGRPRAARRRGPEPAAPELLDDHPPADALHGLRRLVGAVRVRGRRARHRPARQRVDRRGARAWTLVAWTFLSIGNAARHALVVRRARLGRLLGLGSGRERGVHAAARRHARTCTR